MEKLGMEVGASANAGQARLPQLVVGCVLLVLTGCGGANSADVAQITGNTSATAGPGALLTPPGTSTSTPIAAGQPAAIRFVGAQPATIGVRGSGLPEQSTLTFQVTDAAGVPVGGAAVSFAFAEVADESITPLQGVTDTNGNVQVTLTSGERALSIQITAQVATVTPPLTVRSTAVAVLGGPPSQIHFSLAAHFLNISGRVLFGLTDQITAFVGDRFGNAVPPGTAVSFTTSGGAIGNPTTTNSLGQAIGTLVSQQPVPSNGIVTTLATTHGERPFVDKNANGVCDAQDDLLKVSEPFYDSNCNGAHDLGEDFIDLNGDGRFNDDQGSGTPVCGDQVVLFTNFCVTFSGPTNVLLVPSESGPIPAGGSRGYTLTISDDVGNPIVGGSTVSISINGGRGRLIGPANFTLGDAETFGQIIDGVNRFQFSIVDNAPNSSTPEADGITVTVTSNQDLPAGGNGSVTVTDVITFEAAPPPTATPNPPATPASERPAIAPSNATLPQGSGAPPNSCNGGSQTFVVTGGSPPFAVFGGGGCVSVASVPVSGGSFIFTAGNLAGNYVITVTDAAGKTASAGVAIQGPPAPTATMTLVPTVTATPTIAPTFTASFTPIATATPTPAAEHMVLALFVDKGCNNDDGTISTALSAVVTDTNGVAIGGGVRVDFILLPPVLDGVAVTSPGFTGDPPPCVLKCLLVPPEPGDALSCVKYDQAQIGQTVTVQATVQTPSGPLIDTETITLPILPP